MDPDTSCPVSGWQGRALSLSGVEVKSTCPSCASLRTEWGGLDVAALFGADEAHAGHTNAHGAEGPLANRRRQAQRGFYTPFQEGI
jgi:hypothetical protein